MMRELFKQIIFNELKRKNKNGVNSGFLEKCQSNTHITLYQADPLIMTVDGVLVHSNVRNLLILVINLIMKLPQLPLIPKKEKVNYAQIFAIING